jgi:hypothetical protein
MWGCKLVLEERASGDQVEAARVQRDVDAELAIGVGSGKILSAYFSDVAAPSHNVLQALVGCLMGVGARNQTLRFKRRSGGRPSKSKEEPQPANAEDAAILAFSTGDEGALAFYLERGRISDQVRQLLADALCSDGATKQKLVFARARAGNPSTELGTELGKAWLGHTSIELKKSGTWDKVDQELQRLGLVRSFDDTSRKRAVRRVRTAEVKSKKPPE